MSEDMVGKITAIALRSRPKGPMVLVEAVDCMENGGLAGDVESRPDRGITFLSSRQWGEVTSDLGKDIPWHTRRANILVEAGGMGHLIGTTIRVGAIRVRVNAETRPCALMDRLEPGLRAVLTPDCRAGVYGRILESGSIRVGDEVAIVEGPEASA